MNRMRHFGQRMPLVGLSCALLLVVAASTFVSGWPVETPPGQQFESSQPSTQAAPPLALRLSAAFGGAGIGAVATLPEHVLLGMGPRLLVLRTKLADSLPLIAELRLPGKPESIVVQDGMAYIAAGDQGLLIVDVHDPARPLLVAQRDFGESRARDVAVWGQTALVAAEREGLLAFDVSNPAQPTALGAYQEESQIVNAVAVDGGFAYVAQNGFPTAPQIVILELRGSPALVEVGRMPVRMAAVDESMVSDVQVAGGFAYLGLGNEGVAIADVSDPTQAAEVERLGTEASHLAINGWLLAATDRSRAVAFFDLTDPRRPVSVGRYDIHGASALAWSAQTLFVSDGFARLSRVQAADPAQAITDASYDGRNAHVADAVMMPARGGRGPVVFALANRVANSAVEAYDLTTPERPRLLDSLTVPGDTFSLTLAGLTLYVISAQNGMGIVDASDPSHLNELGRYESDRRILGAGAEGNFAVMAYSGDLVSLDVSVPSAPVYRQNVGTLPPSYMETKVLVRQGWAYVATGDDVFSYKVEAPVPGKRWGVDARGLDVIGTHAILASLQLFVFDVTNPANPNMLWATSGRTSSARDLRARGDLLYVATAGVELYRLDPDGPPRRLFGAATGAYPIHIDVDEGLAAVADGSDGLLLYETVERAGGVFLPSLGRN